MIRSACLVWFLSSFSLGLVADELPLAEPLLPLQEFVGHTYRGEFAESTVEKPMVDVQKWERILNGRGIRVTHSVNDGEYGGETIIYWNPREKSLHYHYFTTAGFMTAGTMNVQDGVWTSVEEVTGNPDGITQVKSETRRLTDGRLQLKSQYLKAGEWITGHEIVYRAAPDARVVFK